MLVKPLSATAIYHEGVASDASIHNETKELHATSYSCVTGHANDEDNWNATNTDYAKGWPAEVGDETHASIETP